MRISGQGLYAFLSVVSPTKKSIPLAYLYVFVQADIFICLTSPAAI